MKNYADTGSGSPMQVGSKLIVITRRDLSPGQQSIQAAHAAIEFQHEHPEIANNWNTYSKYLVFLSVENEEELKQLIQKFINYDLQHVVFIEPDIDNQITAVCVEPSILSRKLTSNLPLALKEFNEVLTESLEN